MSVTGSTEWFYEKSQSLEMDALCETIENMRETFIDSFSPEALMEMDGRQLLLKVFSDEPDSMIRQLMFDDNYRWFGAPGKYKYTGIVYQDGSGWKYKESTKPEKISFEEAINKAELVRDQLVFCINEIEKSGVFATVEDYQELQNRIEKVFFYKYTWVIKYYQMLYPQYFPGMYANKTIDRALYILGLPNHGSANRLINVGEISLFIRKCDVNNIVFNKIYSDEWGWDNEVSPCQNAKINYKNRIKPVRLVNTDYYKASTGAQRKKDQREKAEEIDKEINGLKLEGYEKETLIKTRVNQGFFRKSLLKQYGKCCLCAIKNPLLLIASHIKPWVSSQPGEKLDPNNGLLLCPNHDRLFDSGLISFDDEGKIIISDQLEETDRVFSNVTTDMSVSVTEKNKPYLKYHRENVFKA